MIMPTIFLPGKDNNSNRGLKRHLCLVNNLQKGNNGDMYESHQTKQIDIMAKETQF